MTPTPQLPEGDTASGSAKGGQNFVEQRLLLGVDGFGPFSSAQESAQEAMKGWTNEQAVKVLIRNQCLIVGSQVFVTNGGGGRCNDRA